MELVVNEWLPEYFRPDAKEEKKQQVELFLNTFLQRPDCLFVKDPSPFLEKVYKFQKQFDFDLKAREAFKLFVKIILRDPAKCTLIIDNEVQKLPEVTEERLKEGNYISDKYLFETANLTVDKIIITTDAKLIGQMKEDGHFKVILLDDFLSGYK